MARKRQSGLHGNMQKAAEMTVSVQEVREVLDQAYWKENRSLRDVAKQFGMKYGTFYLFLRRHSIPVKDRLRGLRDRWPQGPSWNGGRGIYKSGNGTLYAYVFKIGHPNANTRGYIFEHRWVMSESIGRALMPHEIVHHVNGDTLDNRIENLELRFRGKQGYWHGPLAACPNCGHDLLHW